VSKYIRQLIAQGENQHLDFKFEISDAKKIARTLSAFANSEGGTLLIGVKDNGNIAGIRTDEETYMIESAAYIYCKPKVEYAIKPWDIESKTILEVTVKPSKLRPHQAPWKNNLWRAFVRIKDENFVANAVQVEVWKKLRSNKGTFVKYNITEEKLLAYLRDHEEITLRQFCKLCKINYPTAKKILVNLVAIGIISIQFTENSTSYSLSPVSIPKI
jgi:predicted HTH transcriptional regulator